MSRIIVKNIPRHIQEKDIVKHFSSLDTVTDCKVKMNEQGKSKRFCFIGFKHSNSAKKAIKDFNGTFMGISKITVNEAYLGKRESENYETKKLNTHQNNKKTGQDSANSKKFNEFKKVVQEGIKKSWDDMLIPNFAEKQEPEFINKKTKKSQKEQQKRQKQEIFNEPNSTVSKNTNKTTSFSVKPIKAPQFSEKNKKFIQKPITIDQTRLYITNIPYQLKQEELRKAFAKFGTITKIKLPMNQTGKTKGFAFVSYSLPEEALRAFSKLNGNILFGRIVHIKPSIQDIGQIIKNGKEAQYEKMVEEKYGNSLEEKTSFKKRKKSEMRNKLNDTISWNSIFLNPNTILERVSKKLGISKGQILASENLAPKVALAEAQVIQQTKEWMKSVGVNLDFLGLDKQLCERSKTTLLVKNLNHKTMETDLRDLFNYYGIVTRLLLAPNRAIAVVEYQNESYAQNALEKLQDHKFKNNFLFLQLAPVGILNQQQLQKKAEEEEQQRIEQQELSKVIYIKNLSFQTSEDTLREFFEKHNDASKIKSAKIVYRDGKSMGYGFVEFDTPATAENNIKKLQNSIIDGHKIHISMSQKKKESQQKAANLRQKLKIDQIPNTKLLVKNVAFQATKNELRDLFKEFGVVTKIRLPKKMNGQHRGFGFIEFQSLEQAALAKQALMGTHLYGRRLVIEYENQKSN